MSSAGIHLVAGGSGYLGSLMVQALVRQRIPVRVFDLVDAADRPGNVEFVAGDIRSRDDVQRACEGVSIVHNHVAQVPLAKNNNIFWSVNSDGARNLLAAANASKVQKVVHISSSAVYGIPATNPVTEQSERKPLEEYGKSKLAAEEVCAEFIRQGMDITIIRPRTIMGAGRLGLMQMIFEWIYQNRVIPVLGQGENIFQFVHADDVINACLLAAQKPGSTTYNVGAERFGTMRETLQGLIEHAGSSSRIVCLNRPFAESLMHITSNLGISPLASYHALMYGKSMYFDSTCARNELGWSAQYGNVEMFCQAYDWYVAHRNSLEKSGSSIHRSKIAPGILPLVSRVLCCLKS